MIRVSTTHAKSLNDFAEYVDLERGNCSAIRFNFSLFPLCFQLSVVVDHEDNCEIHKFEWKGSRSVLLDKNANVTKVNIKSFFDFHNLNLQVGESWTENEIENILEIGKLRSDL